MDFLGILVIITILGILIFAFCCCTLSKQADEENKLYEDEESLEKEKYQDSDDSNDPDLWRNNYAKIDKSKYRFFSISWCSKYA